MSKRPRHPRPDGNQKTILRELNELPNFDAYNISKSSDRECPGDILVLERPTAKWQPFELKTETGDLSDSQNEMSEFVPPARATDDILRWFGRID